MATHRTIFDEDIDYEPTPDETAFLARLAQALFDPRVTARGLRDLIHGPENPMLHVGEDGRAWITVQVLASPTYEVMQDLVDRKLEATGELTPGKLARRRAERAARAARAASLRAEPGELAGGE